MLKTNLYFKNICNIEFLFFRFINKIKKNGNYFIPFNATATFAVPFVSKSCPLQQSRLAYYCRLCINFYTGKPFLNQPLTSRGQEPTHPDWINFPSYSYRQLSYSPLTYHSQESRLSVKSVRMECSLPSLSCARLS